ncbi:DUF1441 family protein [Salmonella enterica subsp. enterica]|nr:DUF1441 family protein [Salmonella enterica]EAW1595207.1 DUF1441 family protein [Salmonella enterica subsp. enterica]EBW5403422.1 DUF1441 family protein [Salmonella enterica subsp. enterica serovar Southampton]EDR9147871.1 DUF1441 family protein [Salmonella enterica subsp. enterica serovar Agbeni]EEP8537290.1 DUF1441 family protein [Salmonella enterica subsp. enterica serovar Zega]
MRDHKKIMNINELSSLTGLHRQTVAARLKGVDPENGSNSKLKLYDSRSALKRIFATVPKP